MVSEKTCPNCAAPMSLLATFCRACKKAIPPSPSGAAPATRVSRAAPSGSVTLSAELRRSLVVERLSFSAALTGFVSTILALLGGRIEVIALAGLMAVASFATAYLARTCHPIGRYLLLAYSVFLLLGFPIGTLQAIFQIMHLSRPEAKLIFEGRDRFSQPESQSITTFKKANPGLAAWLRFVNVLGTILILGLIAAIAIPTFLK